MIINNFNRLYWLLFVIFLILGLVNSAFGLLAVVCMIAPVATGFFKGRMWCGRFCPRGSFYDQILARICKRKRGIPQLLKKHWVRWTVFVLLMVFMTYNLYQAEKTFSGIGSVLYTMVVLTTGIGAVLGYFFSPRSWCKICPMGTFAMVVGGGKKASLNLNSSRCKSCGICSRNCPMEIPVHSFKVEGKVNDPDCVKCGVCTLSCPVKALNFEIKS
ncbi:MAG: 4Fe-4S binding protein [Thermosediminibacteraceae bacterium]|nr:4Fe-4S binding protein [Thermosediminibacteraceae bacterium]